jgi:hypothetical protein
VTVAKLLLVVALAGYFTWVVISALIRGWTPDFGTGIRRSEQPGKYWLQLVLCSAMAAGGTIYALVLLDDLQRH